MGTLVSWLVPARTRNFILIEALRRHEVRSCRKRRNVGLVRNRVPVFVDEHNVGDGVDIRVRRTSQHASLNLPYTIPSQSNNRRYPSQTIRALAGVRYETMAVLSVPSSMWNSSAVGAHHTSHRISIPEGGERPSSLYSDKSTESCVQTNPAILKKGTQLRPVDPELEPEGYGALDSAPPPPPPQAPIPTERLLTKRTVIPLINIAYLAFVQQSVAVLTPLVLSTSIEHGGLGMDPYEIGIVLGIWGRTSSSSSSFLEYSSPPSGKRHNPAPRLPPLH